MRIDIRILLERHPEPERIARPVDRVGFQHVLEDAPPPVEGECDGFHFCFFSIIQTLKPKPSADFRSGKFKDDLLERNLDVTSPLRFVKSMANLEHLNRFVLLVGNARSGSTLLGAVVDAHPQAVIANESASSGVFWKNLSAEQILADVIQNAGRKAAMDRPSQGYSYQIGLPPDAKAKLLVAGDKVWNPATLILHGKTELIPSLQDRLGLPLMVLHAIRNPFDVIATMHTRSGAPVSDRIRWYFMHCDAAEAIRARLPADRFLDCHHDDLLADPRIEIERLCRFLDLSIDPDHIGAVREKLFSQPRRTRTLIAWKDEDVEAIKAGIARFEFLSRYTSDCPV
jgi:hypothetical protein